MLLTYLRMKPCKWLSVVGWNSRPFAGQEKCPGITGIWPSGKAREFDSRIRWFESICPCQPSWAAPRKLPERGRQRTTRRCRSVYVPIKEACRIATGRGRECGGQDQLPSAVKEWMGLRCRGVINGDGKEEARAIILCAWRERIKPCDHRGMCAG